MRFCSHFRITWHDSVLVKIIILIVGEGDIFVFLIHNHLVNTGYYIQNDISYSVLVIVWSSLTHVLDIPLEDLHKSASIDELSATIDSVSESSNTVPVICVCRRGNDSQLAVQKIKQELSSKNVVIKDISGGLTSWAKTVDPEFPTYWNCSLNTKLWFRYIMQAIQILGTPFYPFMIVIDTWFCCISVKVLVPNLIFLFQCTWDMKLKYSFLLAAI